MKDVHNKIAAFLREYLDIYGEDIFIDPRKIKKISLHTQEESTSASPSISTSKPRISQPTSVKKPDAPLWNFRNKIKDCTQCPLGHTRNTFVFGEGNEQADIMFIGEAPGAEEDRTGIPFVGPGGSVTQ